MNVESIFLVTSNPMSAEAFQIEAEALGIQIEKVNEHNNLIYIIFCIVMT